MKLNKQTVQYINTLVQNKAKAKKDELDAEAAKVEAKAKKERGAYEAEIEAICKEAAKKAEAAMKKHGIAFDTYWNGEIAKPEVEIGHTGGADKFAGEIERIERRKRELEAKIAEKQTEIIAKLSLGGSAEDLERLISELKF